MKNAITKRSFKILDEFLNLRCILFCNGVIMHIKGKTTRDMIVEIIDEYHITVNDYIELTPGRFPDPSIKVKIDLENKTAEAVAFEKAIPVGLSGVNVCKINSNDSTDSEFMNEYLMDWLTDFKENGASLYKPKPKQNWFYF